MKTLSFWLPAGLTALSLVYLWGCLELSPGTLALPEEGFVPVIFGFLFLGGSGLLLFQDLWKPQEASAPLEKKEITGVLLMIGVFFAYVILLPILGFSLSTFGLILGTGRIMQAGLRASILMGLGVVAVSFLLFIVWLQVPLPSSIFM